MATRVHHPRLTAHTFEAMVANNGGDFDAELIDGEVVVTPPDGPPAGSAQTQLVGRLFAWQQHQPGGLLLADVFVHLDAMFTVGPDIAWWTEKRRPAITRAPIRAVPDWVAEVLSPSTRENDLGPTREAYLSAGVRELWLIDPADGSITVIDTDGRARRAGAHCSSGVLDGFSVRTADLFLD